MTAPRTFAEASAKRAEELGVRLILHKGYRPNGSLKALIMGTNYVIADEFVVELLSPLENMNA